MTKTESTPGEVEKLQRILDEMLRKDLVQISDLQDVEERLRAVAEKAAKLAATEGTEEEG